MYIFAGERIGTMIWIAAIAVFAIIFFREERKKKDDPGYRSWMDDVEPWDQWRRHGKR